MFQPSPCFIDERLDTTCMQDRGVSRYKHLGRRLAVLSLWDLKAQTRSNYKEATDQLQSSIITSIGEKLTFITKTMGFANQTISHSPPSAAMADHIPVIDLSAVTSDPLNSAWLDTIAAIGKACEEWGFFQVTNHGVPIATRERVESAARRFFSLPSEEKRKIKRDETNPLGFYDSEHTKNVKDWKEVFDFTVEEPAVAPSSLDPDNHELRELWNQWPENPQNFRDACREYGEEMVKLAHKVRELICLSLDLPKDHLRNCFEHQTSYLRLNYYPPCPSPDRFALGVGPHKDSSALTIVSQVDGVAGLEVKRKSDGKWILVQPEPGALVINVGDVFQVWSNDRYHSVEHRVRTNREEGRLSMAFFFDPSHYVEVKPLDELLLQVDRDGRKKMEAKYRGYNYGKYYSCRKLSNFKKLNVENIQIEHFKI